MLRDFDHVFKSQGVGRHILARNSAVTDDYKIIYAISDTHELQLSHDVPHPLRDPSLSYDDVTHILRTSYTNEDLRAIMRNSFEYDAIYRNYLKNMYCETQTALLLMANRVLKNMPLAVITNVFAFVFTDTSPPDDYMPVTGEFSIDENADFDEALVEALDCDGSNETFIMAALSGAATMSHRKDSDGERIFVDVTMQQHAYTQIDDACEDINDYIKDAMYEDYKEDS